MANFQYTARTRQGELRSGQMEANDQAAVASILMGRDMIPLNIAPAKTDAKSLDTSAEINFFTPRVKLVDLVIFARQMYSLTRSGIPILRAVNGLADTTHSKRMAQALRGVADQLERGRNLSSALHQFPDIFTELFVSIVHVGENTGQLDEAFLQLSDYLDREQETRKQIKTATRYPTFVLIAIGIAMVVLNIMVIPIFASMFSKLGADLPVMTKVLIGSSNFFMHYWPHMLIALGLGIVLLKRYLNTEKGIWQWDRTKLKLPIIGSIFERIILGRFCRSFSMMIKAGVPLPNALSLVADAVSNAFVGTKIREIRRTVEKGESLSRAAFASGLFSPLVLQMINVGEETGRLDELLQESGEYYEREVDYDLKSLTSKIEPILIGFVAVMVLTLALGIFTPMWDMMNAYKGRS